MSGNFEQAKEFFVRGLGHYEAGRFAEAEAQFAASLALVPGRASTLTNLGAARLKLGRFQDAVDLLEEALAQDADNAQALGHLGTALAELGHAEKALAYTERALQIEPGLGAAWGLRGSLQKEMGRIDAARESFKNAIARGADTELNRYYLASLDGEHVPAAAPLCYVQSLFDGYADGFEDHLVQVLNYRAPEILVSKLAGRGPFAHALDLGCGTGLCGVSLRPLVSQLDGVDLSGNMIERASARGVYDKLVQGDFVEYLRTCEERYQLVTAADVFIYMGALEPVFEAVARVLDAGGTFCFSVEKAAGTDAFSLQLSSRYAHSPGYIKTLTEQYGFEITATAEHSIRDDQRTPIPGLFVWLARR